jgi:uncharacterized protein (DUF1697 family)
VSTRIAFLRAVNLGRRTVPNARLAEICSQLGYGDPWTFINSGNVVFDASGARAKVEAALARALEDEFGFEVTTFVRTPAELRALTGAAPFEIVDGDTHFVTFLASPVAASTAAALEALSNDFDTLVVQGRDVHWRMRGRSTETRIAKRQWEGLLGPNSSTSRNITMLRKLVAKLDGAR